MYQDDDYPLLKLYRIETQIAELLSQQVWLKSGAYLVIEKTEAMYVIDVNSMRSLPYPVHWQIFLTYRLCSAFNLHFTIDSDRIKPKIQDVLESTEGDFAIREMLVNHAQNRAFDSIAYYMEDGSFDMIYGNQIVLVLNDNFAISANDIIKHCFI